MKVSSKQLLIVVGIVLIIFIIIGIWFYRKGKKQTTIAKPPVDNPDSVSAGNNAYGVSFSEIFKIADSLYRDMKGVNVWGHKEEPYRNFNSLSDTDFVKVYNDFNTNHQTEGGTLKKWMESESYALDFGTDGLINSIFDRIARLGLI